VGASFAYFIVPRLLAVEVIGHALFAAHLTAFPIDLQVKIERALSTLVHPYVSAGPTVVVESVGGKVTAWPGLSTALGVDLWHAAHWGLMVEVNANVIATHGLRPELGMFVGPVTRF
jgi:hypothetical protein